MGLTDHRFGLATLAKVDKEYAASLLARVDRWQKEFRRKTGRNFVYASDEFYVVAGRNVPPAYAYDGFPQIENGVGYVRSFLRELRRQAAVFPARLKSARTITLVTGELAGGIIEQKLVPLLRRVKGLTVNLVVAPNTLFGRNVTVAGLLSSKCVYSVLENGPVGNLILLPPDILNADGLFLDDVTVEQLKQRVGSEVMVFDGSWADVFSTLNRTKRSISIVH